MAVTTRAERWHGHYAAIVVRTWEAQPVMHLFKTAVRDENLSKGWAERTVCGQVLVDASWLPVKHLVLFARKCQRCDRIAARREAAA